MRSIVITDREGEGERAREGWDEGLFFGSATLHGKTNNKQAKCQHSHTHAHTSIAGNILRDKEWICHPTEEDTMLRVCEHYSKKSTRYEWQY